MKSMINKTDITMHPLSEYLVEYKELNSENKYRPVAVGRYGIRTRESIYSKELANDYSKNRVIYKGTLTVGMGSVQMDIGILSDDSFYSVSPAYHTYKISGIDYNYLRYCLQCRNSDMFVRFMKRGSRQGKTIDLSRWLTYRIPVYPSSVQREIVERLDKVQTIISSLQKQIQLFDNLIKARFVEMFGDPIKNPKKLSVVTLGELSELITKGASPSWQGFSYTDDKTQTLFVTSENVREGFVDIFFPKYIEDGFNEKQKRSILKRGDFLINIVGASIGRVAQFDYDLKANINQAIALVRIKDKRISDKYLLTYLNSEKAKQMYNSMKTDTGRANLSLQDINNLSILLPPIEKQIEFEDFITQVDKSKSAVKKALDEAQLLFDSLMQKYFG